MNREEVRAALGPEACAVLDGLRTIFDAKLVHAEFSDGRSVGRKPSWAELELREVMDRGNKAQVMTDEQYAAYLKDLERAWKEFERARARRRA